MAYAVVLTLDEQLSREVTDTWHSFETASIGKTPGQLNEPPHITFAISRGASPATLWSAVRDVAFANAELKLLPFGVFTGDRHVVYLNAVLSEGLGRSHRDLYRRLTQDNVATDPLYAPGNVLFHCTIAVEVEPARLAEAVTLLSGRETSHSGCAVTVDLWEFFPVQLLHRREISCSSPTQ